MKFSRIIIIKERKKKKGETTAYWVRIECQRNQQNNAKLFVFCLFSLCYFFLFAFCIFSSSYTFSSKEKKGSERSSNSLLHSPICHSTTMTSPPFDLWDGVSFPFCAQDCLFLLLSNLLLQFFCALI